MRDLLCTSRLIYDTVEEWIAILKKGTLSDEEKALLKGQSTMQPSEPARQLITKIPALSGSILPQRLLIRILQEMHYSSSQTNVLFLKEFLNKVKIFIALIDQQIQQLPDNAEIELQNRLTAFPTID